MTTIAIRAAAEDARILVLLDAGDTPFRVPADMTGPTTARAPDPAHSRIILAS